MLAPPEVLISSPRSAVKTQPTRHVPYAARQGWQVELPRRGVTYVLLTLTVLLALAPLWQIAVLAFEPDPEAGGAAGILTDPSG